MKPVEDELCTPCDDTPVTSASFPNSFLNAVDSSRCPANNKYWPRSCFLEKKWDYLVAAQNIPGADYISVGLGATGREVQLTKKMCGPCLQRTTHETASTKRSQEAFV